MSYNVHDILKIRIKTANNKSELPIWAVRSLTETPYVVVRRGKITSHIPVGIRGETKQQRFAWGVSPEEVLDIIKPQDLLTSLLDEKIINSYWYHILMPLKRQLNLWKQAPCLKRELQSIGISGSVGFELATGKKVTNSHSDVDLLFFVNRTISQNSCLQILDFLNTLEIKVDPVLVVDEEWISLEEYALSSGSYLIKTMDGCRLGNIKMEDLK